MGERPGELAYDAEYDALNEPTPGMGVPPDYVAGGTPGAVGYYGTADTRATTPGDTRDSRTNIGAGDTVTEDQDPTALRHDIAQTRQHMSSTIDAIQEKLSPQHM